MGAIHEDHEPSNVLAALMNAASQKVFDIKPKAHGKKP
jgi:hypothetical protein